MSDAWPWLVLAGLGAFHGVNPAMGWLFAVGLGLQEKRRRVVLAALGPIAAGHALSVGAVVAVFAIAQDAVDAGVLRIASGAALVAFGAYRLVRTRHPRWVGMRVSGKDLVAWSALMATAHGAGLMLLPALLGLPASNVPGHHHAPDGLLAAPLTALAAVGVHTLAMLAVTGAVALVVYERLGLALLRRAWFNLDLVWAAALVGAGLVTVLI